MVPILGFFLSSVPILLVLFFVWYFLLTDRDTVLFVAEKFGRPVSDFAGKVVWVTGASTGLGEAMAHELASVGAKLILTARSEDLLEQVKEECIERSRGKLVKKDILILSFDLAKTECHKENVENAINHFGKIDILINNAARYQVGPIIETDMEVDRAVFDVNYFGTISLTKLVLKQFLQQGRGQFVVVSSIAGKYGIPATASYTGTKHALQGYFDALRTEHQRDKIFVTLICPGIFSSDIFSKTMTTQKDKGLETEYNHYECVNMSSERCAHLTLVAIINKLFESWIAFQPFQLMLWGSQFTPDFFRLIMKLIYTKKRLAQLNKGIWPKDIPVWRPLFSKAG